MHSSTRLWALAAIALLTVALSGCSTAHPRRLTDISSLSDGRYVDLASEDAPRIHAGNYSAIDLGSVDTELVADCHAMSRAEASRLLTAALIEGEGSARVLLLQGSGPAARLDVSITELDPGDAFARVMAGELGAGHAYVQVEARVMDAATETLLSAAVDRRNDSGLIGLRDTFGSASTSLLREMLTAIGRDLKKELANQFQAPEQGATP